MKINGLTIILDLGEEVTIKAEKSEDITPTPTPTTGKMSFSDMLNVFNEVLLSTGHNAVVPGQTIYSSMNWEYNFANREWDNDNSEFFSKTNMPEIYEYNGSNKAYTSIAYNAMQAWLMASQLAEYVPTYGAVSNTQTLLFKVAYRIDGANELPIYGDYDIRSDVNKVREAAAFICSYCHSEYNSNDIAKFRQELNGQMIPASTWEELGYENTILSDSQGRRGYTMDNLGYLVNTQIFMPNTPGPRVPGTTGAEMPFPYEEGEPKELFNLSTGNYKMDETINSYMVNNYNMMAQTPLNEWNNYPFEKKQRIINAAATVPCTSMYMFGAPKKINQVLNNGQLPIVNGYPQYVFEENSNGTYTIDGPFSDLAGIYRYNVSNKNAVERFLDTALGIADNMRFPTLDPNYGRRRPGCGLTRNGTELNPVHGSKENEIFNITIASFVADDEAGRQRCLQEDGWAADSPRSYVSGHSTQIIAIALILSQMNPNKTIDYMRRAHEYSVNRSIARFHWNSDCIQGRLFGTMAAPIIRAMSGLQNGFEQTQSWINNPQPTPAPAPTGDWKANLIIKNQTGSPISSTGEIRLYVGNHIGVNTYLPGADVTAGPLWTFNPGENNFSDKDVHCILNGDDYMSDEYNGSPITEIRFYDYRHWNNIDAGFNATLDTSDPRCDSTLKKSGGTYVIKITNL